MKKSSSVELRIIRIPDSIIYKCPYCNRDVKMKYCDFIDIAGEPCDWTCEKFECPDCEKMIEINSIDWDY